MDGREMDAERKSMVQFGGAVGIVLFVLICFVWFLDSGPLSGTESHRAIPSHQMIESGDWLMPRLWGVPYLTKPPLHYWILTLSGSLFGTDHPWVWRFPSALSASLTALVVIVFGRRWFGAPAGLIAGLSFVGIFALWSQNAKADIDANHTLACVLAALALIDLAQSTDTRSRTSKLLMFSVAMCSAAAMFMLKGPAGLPLMIGAILGPAWVLRSWKSVANPWGWGALVLASIPFFIWTFLVWRDLRMNGTSADWSGVSEVSRNVSIWSVSKILEAITFPLVLLAYTMPHSGLALFGYAVSTRDNRSSTWSPSQRRVLRMLVASFIMTLVIAAFARMTNPRYMYIAAPLLCPVVGIVLDAWRRKVFVRRARKFVDVHVVIACAVVLAIQLMVSYRIWTEHDQMKAALTIVGLVVLAAAAFTLAVWSVHTARSGSLVCAFILLLAICTPTYAWRRAQDRWIESSCNIARDLREAIGPGEVVWASKWVFADPELFYYAGVRMQYCPVGSLSPDRTPSGVLILFQQGEFNDWMETVGPEALEPIEEFATNHRRGVLARYRFAGTISRASDTPNRDSNARDEGS